MKYILSLLSLFLFFNVKAQLQVAQASSTNITCNGQNNGTITFAVTGGANPIVYTNTPVNSFTNLPAGSYTVTATDAMASTLTSVFVISEPPAIVFATVNVHEVYCYSEATGSVAVVAHGGAGNLSYSITPNTAQFPLGFFKDMQAGNYTITASDMNGCNATTAITIIQKPALIFTTLEYAEPLCANDTSGLINVTATGGSSPIVYSLNSGIPNLTGKFTGLKSDLYKITLIDDLGCSKDTMLQLNGPSAVTANIQIEDAKCENSKDGRIYAAASGGHGGYIYYLTPGFAINKTGDFYDLETGTYTLRIVDTVGCEYKTFLTINPPPDPLRNIISKQDLACTGKGNEGSATANVSGGKTPYVYEWSTSPVQTTSSINSLYYGWYHILVSDANGCTVRDSVYIEEGHCCDVTFIPDAFSPNGDNNNDEFKIFSTASIVVKQLEVYDRWGQRLWSTSDYRRGWNGTVDGKEAPVATYFYILRYRCTRDGKDYLKKGEVTLVR